MIVGITHVSGTMLGQWAARLPETKPWVWRERTPTLEDESLWIEAGGDATFGEWCESQRWQLVPPPSDPLTVQQEKAA